MNSTYENFGRFHALKNASKADSERHHAKSPRPWGAVYGGHRTRDPIGIRPDTPRPHRHSRPDSLEPPITPYRHGRPPQHYAPRPTPYGERPARGGRWHEIDERPISRAGTISGHPKYRRDGAKTILELANHRFDDPKPERLRPRRAEAHPRHQLKELRPSQIVQESPEDVIIVDSNHGALAQYQSNNNASHGPGINGNTPPLFANYELTSSIHEMTIDSLKQVIDQIHDFDLDAALDKNPALAPSVEAPEPGPAVSDPLTRSCTPLSRGDVYAPNDRVGIHHHHGQDIPLVERHLRHGEPFDIRKHSETKDVIRDRAMDGSTRRRTIHPELDRTDHIPRSLRASTRTRTVDPVEIQYDHTQNRHSKDRYLDTTPMPPPRSHRGIEKSHTSRRGARPELDPIDRLTRDLTSIKLEDRAIGSQHRQAQSRPRQNPYTRNRGRQQIVEESRSHRWKPTPGSCRPGLQMTQEELNQAKYDMMYIMVRGCPAEDMVSVGLSREAVFYALTELELSLPPSVDFTGLHPYWKAYDDGFDNTACKLRALDELRADQLVTMDCDQDTMMSLLTNLSLSDASSGATPSNQPATY